ncbi:methyl-accepting chemotaxis protein [Vibrio kyushuensis]|uniref:methyl-accepting chemotaxis protein n=1 Tax=Vibrio kyushuensis TaxID=2910249 RepID=UPI003D0B69FC
MLLRSRITLLVVVLITLVVISLTVANQVTLANSNHRFEQSTMLGRSELWKQIINGQTKAMENATSTLIRDRDTRKALQRGQLDKLKESASTTYNLFSASGVLSRMQLTDTKGVVQFSSPVIQSRNNSKQALVDKAIKEGKLTHGIERDGDGKLLNIVVFPLSMRGKAIGTGIYGKELTQAIDDFKAINHSEVLIQSLDGNVDYVTEPSLFSALSQQLLQLESNSANIIEANNAYYSVINLPIKNDAGVTIAHFITAKDFTQSYLEQRSTNILVTSIIIAIVFIALFAVYKFMAHELKPLESSVSNLKELSAGDLSLSVEVTSSNEIGQLQDGLKITIESLRDIVSQIVSMIELLVATSSNIGNSAATTRDGVHTEQAELEQLTTAITELTATVKEIATSANVAASSTERSNKEAQNGQSLVQQTITSIESLAQEIEDANDVVKKVEDDSNAIGTIIDTIKGIAEQTNLLALNAAIEAARAGDQGRGFAVVADEVRTLASRTQTSTQEIQDMIESLQSKVESASQVMQSSQEKVRTSVELASQSGESLQSITEMASDISNMIIQIATAAEEQAAVSEEINRNAVNINTISQQSAEGADTIFKETDQLADVTTRLKNIVDRFKF